MSCPALMNTFLFVCDGCSENIPTQKARVHCLRCPDFDLCANCYVIGATPGNHAHHHPTEVIKESGCFTSAAVPEPISQPIPSPPSVTRNSQASQTSALQPRAVGASRSPGPAPTPVPQLPPRRAAPPTGWQPLFDGNLPSPMFVALLNDIFNILDPQRTGHLTPERYSSFLDVQGYTLDQNVWKKSLTPAFGYNKEDLADYEWRTSLNNFSIEYILVSRHLPANNDMENLLNGMNNVHLNQPHVRQIFQATKPKSFSDGQMPCMTRKGFIDITTVEMLSDPSDGWGMLSRALRTYGIWKDKGPLPREMLPAYPPPAILERIKRITEFSRRQASDRINGAAVQAQLAQQGQRAALDLLDDRRYYYY